MIYDNLSIDYDKAKTMVDKENQKEIFFGIKYYYISTDVGV